MKNDKIERAYSPTGKETDSPKSGVRGTYVRHDGETCFVGNPRMSISQVRSAEDFRKFKAELLRAWSVRHIEKRMNAKK